MSLIETFKTGIQNTCRFNNIIQVNLFIIAVSTIIFQGILFGVIDKKKFKVKTWIFYLLFGIMSNVFYFRTFAQK
jgi:hypothetical protein